MDSISSPSSAANDRIRAWRQARRQAGLVKLELWVPAAARDDVRAAVRAIVTDSTRSPRLAVASRSLAAGDSATWPPISIYWP